MSSKLLRSFEDVVVSFEDIVTNLVHRQIIDEPKGLLSN